ncbi:uncharacterized protein RAG0_02515 [Rhynchosporium agropyri]|uniref:Uncharacterized protein n=1 Tax=Rhynchosporium agropyri TaxID=914238 RepID=A0A1E1K5V5_9HELO|nr:uncharacterized protein RAG0_02515 [Rhynchosporium agropyri]
MLPTRLLAPQFLLSAWNSQLAQAAQRVHRSDYATEDNENRRYAGKLGHGPEQNRRNFERSKVNLRRDHKPIEAEKVLESCRPEYREQRDGNQNANRTQELQSKTQHDGHEIVLRQRNFRYNGHRVFTPSKRPRYSERVVERNIPMAHKPETHSSDQEREESFKGLSLFEELFPEEAMARQKRENKARERLEKLPAFNWNMDSNQLAAHDRRQQEAREKTREKQQTIPGLKGENGVARKIILAKQIPQSSTSSQRMGQGQHVAQDQSRTSKSTASVLVLSACSKNLEESDFYRVGPKGNHIENWTSGILKVIPARDNVTLEPIGQYYLLFSSLAAARLYLDKTQRLLELSKSSNYFSRPNVNLREGEDLEAVKRNFTLVPAGGRLSLRLLEPPHSKGVQWMIDAAGTASLVTRQDKSQHIVLFSTDRGHIKIGDLENAIMDDGKRRNLHWKLAGAAKEAIVKLETTTAPTRENELEAASIRRSNFQGPARYTISFRDSNEARRFAREWHQRPYPATRVARPEEDEPPTMNAEILW